MDKWSAASALADLIRTRVPIEDVISDEVTLEKREENWVGACPFRGCANSLEVSPKRGFFYCYGCQACGNVIAFVQQLDGVNFEEALLRLSERLPTIH